MRINWTLLVAFSGLALLANGWTAQSSFAAENPESAPVARNPLRESQVIPPARSTDNGDSSTARSDLVRQLQATLAGSDRSRAIVAIHRLQECGAAGATVLAQSLAEPNQPIEIRFSTLRSLNEMGPVAVPALLGLLEPSQGSGREFAWQVLERLGPRASSATPTLIHILRDRDADSDDRSRAVGVLGQIGPAAGDAFGLLLEIAERDQDAELRLACLNAMCLVGGTSPDKQSRLVRLLLNEDEEGQLRVAAAAVLVQQPSPPQVVLPALIGLAQHPDNWNVCAAAAEALGKLGPDAGDAILALMTLLDHEVTDVRLAAITACGAIGSAALDAVPSLVRRIQLDEETSVTESAARALIKIDPNAVNTLLTGLNGDGSTREHTLQALSAMGPAGRTAVPHLLKMLADPELSDLHLGIVHVLRSIGPDAAAAISPLESLLAASGQPVEVRVEAALALGAIGLESVPSLFAALRDQEPAVRVAAAQSLAMQNIRERTAIPGLLRELINADAADAAADALVTIGQDAIPFLCDLIRDQQIDLERRAKACGILGRIGGSAAPILVQALQDRDDELAAAAEQALLELGPRTAIPALLDAIQQHDQAASQRHPPAPPTAAPELSDVTVERMLQLVVDLSGGMGGPVGMGGNAGLRATEGAGGGTAGSMPDAPAAEAPPPPPTSAASAPRMPQPAHGAKAGAPAAGVADRAPDGEPSTAPLPRDMDLKVVKVFYGTNRQAISTGAQRRLFAWRGFLPALAIGGATILVCGIGFARSRSPLQSVLVAVGVVATLCLAFPAAQQSSDSARSFTHRAGPVYGSDPNDQLELGMCEVSIPADHKTGELESPSILRLEFDQDPRKHIVLRDVTPCGEEQFHAQLKRNLVEKGNNILVFVHGYNVDFDNAARRTAQLACDLEFTGVPLFFSWPSQGNWYEYRQDEKQVELAVPLLKRFLLDVASRSQATSIHLIAHSMGNRALTAALQEMESTALSHSAQFNQVVLAAPDIDADVFRQRIAPAIINQAQRVTLYASSNDLALTASRTFNSGDLRAGDTSRGLMLTPGIETIDVSGVDTSLLGHSYYGDSPTVLTDLKELLQSSHPADERPFLQPVAVEQLRYWVFHHPEIASQPTTAAIR